MPDVNLAPSLVEALGTYGEADALVFGDERTSYSDLAHLVVGWRDRLRTERIGSGRVVALDGATNASTCSALLALLDSGAIVVPLTSLPEAKRAEFLDVAEVETVICIQPGHPTVENTDRAAGHEYYERLRAQGHSGIVLFSSGTTGQSKASVLDGVKVMSRYQKRSAPRRTLSFLSLDHIGGINTLLHTVSNGGAIVSVEARDPETVFAAIEEHQVGVLPTTPTFLNMALISGAYRSHDISSLELVTYGTEPMPARVLRRLVTELPATRFKQTYGLSELGILPTRSKGNDTLWLELGSAGFDHKVVDGVLHVRSDMAMLGYLNAEAPFDEEGYFNTQDMVEVDGPYLKILGRKSEIINVGGEKVYPIEVENTILELPFVADVRVGGRPNPVMGSVVYATVKVIEGQIDPARAPSEVQRYVRSKLEGFKVPALVTVDQADQHSDRFKKVRVA